jgi:hypothetical protein
MARGKKIDTTKAVIDDLMGIPPSPVVKTIGQLEYDKEVLRQERRKLKGDVQALLDCQRRMDAIDEQIKKAKR